VVVKGIKNPVLFVSTDLSLSAKAIIEIYSSRFSIEIAFRDLKHHFGFGDYQTTSAIGIFRFVHLCCISLNLKEIDDDTREYIKLVYGNLNEGN